MIIFAILIALIVVGVLIQRKSDDISGAWVIGSCISLVSAILLVTALICWPTNYYDTKASIQQYNAVKATVENARNGEVSDIERAALTTQIIKVNKELASAKYWNDGTFDIFIADEFAELEPLK